MSKPNLTIVPATREEETVEELQDRARRAGLTLMHAFNRRLATMAADAERLAALQSLPAGMRQTAAEAARAMSAAHARLNILGCGS